jgi:manganese/zinc/iron transport system permease protein
LPGIFLVLRGIALMSDAISHSVILGIVVMFLWCQALHPVFLLLGAVGAGLVTVFCVETIIKTSHLIKKDAAIGLVFPLFFSLAVILISLYARDVHIDADMVLLGELAFAPFNRIYYEGIDCGPYALWASGAVAVVNSASIYFLYKYFEISTFDASYSRMIGISFFWMHYYLMFLTSITAVVSFDIVGAVIVVAFMITPAASAYLLADQLPEMINLTVCFAIISAIVGYIVASCADISLAGAMASMAGLCFIMALGLNKIRFCVIKRNHL